MGITRTPLAGSLDYWRELCQEWGPRLWVLDREDYADGTHLYFVYDAALDRCWGPYRKRWLAEERAKDINAAYICGGHSKKDPAAS